jgi:hypothetical protein
LNCLTVVGVPAAVVEAPPGTNNFGIVDASLRRESTLFERPPSSVVDDDPRGPKTAGDDVAVGTCATVVGGAFVPVGGRCRGESAVVVVRRGRARVVVVGSRVSGGNNVGGMGSVGDVASGRGGSVVGNNVVATVGGGVGLGGFVGFVTSSPTFDVGAPAARGISEKTTASSDKVSTRGHIWARRPPRLR